MDDALLDDELLMAYADGELDPARQARVEAAMRADPAVAAAVERHRALRADVFAAFAGVLDEPVPARLQAAAAPAASAAVRVDALAAAGARPLPARWRWGQAGALAASLAVGVLVGALAFRGGGAPLAPGADGVVAQGDLARALSTQLAAAQDSGQVRVGVSFIGRDGGYCRSFQMGTAAGLACRSGEQWRIPVLADGAQAGDGYRQAGSALPPAVLDAIDARIAGPTLDAAAERAARDGGWKAPARK